MRIALCLSGMAGGRTAKMFGGQMWDGHQSRLVYPVPDCQLGYQHYQQHIFDHNDVDVFIHTWSPELQDELEQLYQPKKGIYKPDKLFHAAKRGQHSGDPSYPDGVKSKRQITISRWYSMQKSVALKKEYEQEHGFVYDCVMVGRFDVAWLTKVNFSQFDMRFFYASNWCVMKFPNGTGLRHENWYHQKWNEDQKAERAQLRHTHTGYPHTPHYRALADYWFFSNSAMIDQFADLYDHIDQYLSAVGPSNHELSWYRLHQLGIVSKLKFAFHIHNDCHLVRHVYTDWRKSQ